ncbi:Sec-independent protein translocase protein TatB [Qipengyuania sp. MTN3-11]|uniref:Sec-independent protein translocase protein TatB n=1 Tax=Qipengyuania sp. MTN3-11 TaxID=3056557 RepID=UPI0036F3F721
MFDIGAMELLIVVVVAILVIGPKDMPMALRSAGRWIGKMRRMSNHFRAGIDNMIREAELEDAEKEWRERNAKIMADHPGAAEQVREPENLLTDDVMEPLPSNGAGSDRDREGGGARAEATVGRSSNQEPQAEPELPLEKSKSPTEQPD